MKFNNKFVLIFLLLLGIYSSTESAEDFWDGKQYINNPSLQFKWASKYIEKLKLKGNEKILDIGCGDGRITALIAKSISNGYIIGIDNSISMLEIANQVKDNSKNQNLKFIKCAATELNFDNVFDYIVSFSCFHWLSDHLVVLKNIEKALKPNGRIFLYFAPDHGSNRLDHAISIIASTKKWQNYFSDFSNPFSLSTPAKFLKYSEEAKLLLKRIEILTIDEVFQTKEAFLEWMTGWMPHLKQLPKELHRTFLDEIIDYYLKYHPLDDENTYHYIDYWMEVELLKSA